MKIRYLLSEAALRELGEEAQAVLEAGVVGAQPQLLVPLQADLVERALDERGHASPPPPTQVGRKSTNMCHRCESVTTKYSRIGTVPIWIRHGNDSNERDCQQIQQYILFVCYEADR